MSVTSNIYTISAYILIVHYGTAYAHTSCYSSALGDVYNCPDDMVCCSTDLRGCCTSPTFAASHTSVDYGGVISFLTAALIIFVMISCCCLLCSCCRRRRSGVVYASGVTSTVVSLPPQTVPQGYPNYPPGQPPYPPNTGYNPYYGVPPPDYQTTIPNPVSNPHVASAPPAMRVVNQV